MLQRNSSMLRRRFLQVGTTASAAAFGLRSVFAAQEEKRPRASSLDVRNPESIRSFLRNWFRLRSGVRNPLPGVYSSHGIETVYLIRCGDASVLVDTGFQHNFLGHLENFKTAGHDLDRVEAVLTSHFHVDHTAALRDANRVLGCPVVGHKNNLKVMGEGDLLATAAHMWAIPGWRFSYQPYDIDIVVEEGDTLQIGDSTFRVFHLPGHTPGCTGYLWNGHLITGDVLFPPGALGWNDVHWGSSYRDAIDTMKKIASLKPDHLLPSHGVPFPCSPEVTDNGTAYAEHMMENNRHGPMLLTLRAAQAAAGRKPRQIQVRG